MSPLARLRRFGIPTLLAGAFAVLMSGCGNVVQPQNVLDPQAPIARELDKLWNPVFGIAVAVFVLVEVLVVVVMIKFRRRSDDESPKQIHGHTAMEIGWTAAPAIILAVVGFFTVLNIGKLDAYPKGANVMRVNVIGHQWWWEYEYPKQGIVTANELHIPTGPRLICGSPRPTSFTRSGRRSSPASSTPCPVA